MTWQIFVLVLLFFLGYLSSSWRNWSLQSTEAKSIETSFGSENGVERVGMFMGCGVYGNDKNICSNCSETFTDDMISALVATVDSPSYSVFYENWRNHFDINKSGKGEEFLLLNRALILRLQKDHSLQCLQAWEGLPSPSDKLWPMPSFEGVSIEDVLRNGDRQPLAIQSLEYWNSVSQLLIYELWGESQVSSYTLDDFGRLLYVSLYMPLLEAYNNVKAVPNGFCSYFQSRGETCRDGLKDVTHLFKNPYFWGISSLVDYYLGYWLEAKGYKVISRSCKGARACYEWKVPRRFQTPF